MKKYITFDELNLVMCRADTKRKIINPVWDKLCLDGIRVFYSMGYVFREKNNPKKYYSVEEVEKRFKENLNVSA
jgi:hypothetical protein